MTDSFDSATPRSRTFGVGAHPLGFLRDPHLAEVELDLEPELGVVDGLDFTLGHTMTVYVKPFVSRSRTLYRALLKCQPDLVSFPYLPDCWIGRLHREFGHPLLHGGQGGRAGCVRARSAYLSDRRATERLEPHCHDLQYVRTLAQPIATSAGGLG